MKNKKKGSSHFYAALSSGVIDFAKEMSSIPAGKNKPGGYMITNKSTPPVIRLIDISKGRKDKTCDV